MNWTVESARFKPTIRLLWNKWKAKAYSGFRYNSGGDKTIVAEVALTSIRRRFDVWTVISTSIWHRISVKKSKNRSSGATIIPKTRVIILNGMLCFVIRLTNRILVEHLNTKPNLIKILVVVLHGYYFNECNLFHEVDRALSHPTQY